MLAVVLRAAAALLLVPHLGLAAPPQGERKVELAERMMESTVRLESPGSSGSGFFLLDPRDNPRSVLLLVTAAHVFQSAKGPTLEVAVRERTKDGWVARTVTVQLVEFYGLPDLDIAMMPVDLVAAAHPSAPITPDLLADDEQMQEHGVAVGAEVLLVSYPLGLLANEEGFGLLKSGHIATFPIFPTRTPTGRRAVLLDREILDGEYGAPVFKPSPQGGAVVGIVAKPWSTTNKIRMLTVLPASHILDTLDGFNKLRAANKAAPSLRSSVEPDQRSLHR